jgi:hypothetical protein
MPHKFRGKNKTVIFVCTEQRCLFSNIEKERNQSQHLPVLVIDEDIYDWPPTLIIGTVDKFAMLTWRELAGRIFGVGLENDYDPPDMIIQDELHLISGPLGSVVGLFESAIDILCSRKGRKPKIIASTATIRRAWNQGKALYDRATFQFPPQGLDISDSFFAKEDPQSPGRIYTGVFAPAAPSFITAEVRTVSSLLQSCKSIPLPAGVPEKTRDPYWTLVLYFNSLRELGHAATLVQQDIPEYIWTLAMRGNIPKKDVRSFLYEEEMTSRRKAEEIPVILNRLGNVYPKPNDNSTKYPLDILLATNMISVGLDVDRLGLILMVGQPKTTSEYIQASSRVGRSRSAPGLVVTMYNPGRPRDRSHYEHFRDYHESFYKFVEPTSVTPYSLSVLDRALHSVLVILIRHYTQLQSPDTIDLKNESIKEVIKLLKKRCEAIDPEHLGSFDEKINQLLTDWSEITPEEWGSFGTPDKRPLMYPAGAEPLEEWNNSSWPTLSSMRNIDTECNARVLDRYPSEE